MEEENKKIEEKDNETLKSELEETTDRLKRLMAEFDNYKKRSSKEKEMLYNTLLGDIITAFLPVLDNLDKAASAESKDEAYKQGVNLVIKQFKEVFKSNGVEEIETIGKTFDPEVHEAVSSMQDATKGEKEITAELRKGYKIGNKVIRHAMVIVAN